MPDGLQVARLRAAELDDQALAEIGALLGESAQSRPRTLEALARAQNVAVVRRACGLRPEIVGVALREDGHVTSALDRRFAREQHESALRALLAPAASLFRRRDRAPLGLAQAAG